MLTLSRQSEQTNMVATIETHSRVEILGAWIDDISLDQSVDRIVGWSKGKKANPDFVSQQVITLNPEYVTLAKNNSKLMELINKAGLVTPDGVGLIYAGMVLGRPLRNRVTGVSLTHALARRSAEMNNSGEGQLRLFLLGAAPGIAEQTATRLQALYPGITIVGTFSGKAGPEGDTETIARVKESKADVVLVAYGMLKQDYWIERNLQATGAAAGIGIGGTFDYIAGIVPTPPTAIKKIGMEWAYRIVTQKGRWKRATFVPKFIGTVALHTTIYRASR